MKKHLVLILFLFSLTPALAQVGDSRHLLSVGINGGLGTSNVSFIPTIKQAFHPGMTIGGTIRYTSEKYFFLICGNQIECNVVNRGWKEQIEDGSGNEYNRVATYIEIPIFAHLGFGREFRGVQGFVNLGPQVAFLIGETENYGGRTPWDISNRPNQVTWQYGKAITNKVDYGIAAGAGIELRTGIGAFGIEGRYYFGLGNIYGITKKDYFGRCANSTISVRATYLFSL